VLRLREERTCRGAACAERIEVKPGSVNPHNQWCRACCPECERHAEEARSRYVGHAYGTHRDDGAGRIGAGPAERKVTR